MKVLLSASCLAILLSCPLGAAASPKIAETPDEASHFLAGQVNTKAITVDIGNEINKYSGRAAYIVNGTWTSYSKGMFGRLKPLRSQRTTAQLHFLLGPILEMSPDGSPDNCFLTIGQVEYQKGSEFNGELHGKTTSVVEDDKHVQVVDLDLDPASLRFAPYSISMAGMTFQRTEYKTSNYTVFVLRHNSNVAPRTTFTVQHGNAADLVENALRVLQLSCTR